MGKKFAVPVSPFDAVATGSLDTLHTSDTQSVIDTSNAETVHNSQENIRESVHNSQTDTLHTSDTLCVNDTSNTPRTRNTYRFNLVMPSEFKEYLNRASFRSSSAEHTVTVTEYICNLIRKDMEEHSNDT